jgi:RNA polymerase sigma-70 factor (ECF subfamily)
MPMHTTPPSLLQQLRSPDDQSAWRRFVDLYTPLLFYWARRVGLQESDAADLVQEVFTLLIRKLPEFTYDPNKGFRNWLLTVLRNKWREIERRQPSASVGGESPERTVGDGLAVVAEEEFQRHLVVRALELMQGEFQPTTWKACWEHAAVGRPAAEVAAELGMSVNPVYLATSRVLRRLRQELAGQWP